jgi:hypothetical protein
MTSAGTVPILDGHNDVLSRLYRRGGTDVARAFLEGEGKGQLDLPMAQQGGFVGGLFAIFVPSRDGANGSDGDGPPRKRSSNEYSAPTVGLIPAQQAVSGTSLLSTQVQSDDPTVLDRYTARLRRFLGVARAVRSLGAPALALAYVSCGRFDAFYEDNMSPWDTLAGTLLIEEAGGRVTAFNGMPRPLHRRSDILATNGPLHQQLVATMSGELLSVPLRS